MTAHSMAIADERVSIERHRVVLASRWCDVGCGSSHVRGRGSWHWACPPSPRRLFRQETSYAHHGGRRAAGRWAGTSASAGMCCSSAAGGVICRA